MKSVKSRLVKDVKDEVKERINDQVDPSVEYRVDENLLRPLEEIINPIVDETKIPDEEQQE